jgi:hypothetical protein
MDKTSPKSVLDEKIKSFKCTKKNDSHVDAMQKGHLKTGSLLQLVENDFIPDE